MWPLCGGERILDTDKPQLPTWKLKLATDNRQPATEHELATDNQQPATPLGRRIVVYGASGSGKTSVARELGRALGLPMVELDAIYHARPGWQDLARDEFRERVVELLEEHPEGWVMDGNYSLVRDLILPLADTVVWLRLPFLMVYWRLARRTITRAKRREELWNGNRETLRQTFLSRDSMLLWGITAWRKSTRNTREALATIPHGARVIEVRSGKEAARLMEAARSTQQGIPV